MEHAEIDFLMLTEGKGHLDPQDALQLARAARNVVLAEFRTAHLRVTECEMLLETLKDAEEQAHTTCDANDQIGSLLTFFHRQGIRIDLLPPLHDVSTTRHTFHMDSLPSFPSLHSETHSVDSDFEESFSVSCCPISYTSLVFRSLFPLITVTLML